MGDLPTYEFSGAGLTAAMRALGANPDAIAGSLLELGCRGKKGCESNCPLARYVHLVYPSARGVYVLLNDDKAAYVIVEIGWGEHLDRTESDDLVACGQFIRRFDGGQFPDLIEEAPDAAGA